MKNVEQGLPPFPDRHDLESLQHHLQGLLVGAMQAMEGAGRTVCDFTDAVPWEFTMDMARQVWDESRHVEIFIKLREHVEGYIGEDPETTNLWRCACAETPEERVAGVNRGLEGLACDLLPQLIALAKKIGDPVIERALDFILADELTHVRMGSKWLRELMANAPERLRQALAYQQSEVPMSIARDAPYAVV
jgi:uncharacterized ferritin-like protein (DUF455 family)